MPRKTTICPLCLVPYVSVRQHCLKLHQIYNRKELRLVMSYASGIHSGPLDCPICKCRGRVRLDKHLENVHKEIKREHYKGIVKAAKQRAVLLALRDLRKSKPDPPMVSKLDLDKLSSSSEDEEEQQEEERTSSNNPGSSASVSSPARQCGKCGHLKQKVRHLESLLHSPRPTPPLTSPDTTTPSRKKFERVKTKFKGPTPQLENVLNVWMKHIKGSNKRQEENAKQRLTHVRNWLIFMADGGIPAMSLPFLQNKERLIEWVNSLKKKHAVTTQLINIGNVRSFLKFLIEAELPQVKVPKKHLHGTLFSLQTLAKTARKELQTHRQAVRLKKSSSFVNPANITAFLSKANKEIPLALCTLDKEKSREALERVYGLLSGLIACITGHRRGVIINLMVEEFALAEVDELERRIIRVKEHKTKETFGHALIPLMKTEYMWFYRLIYNRHKYPCGKSELVFSNSNGGPFNDILTAFQNCWESFGLPGRPTFSLIRSSISTCVGRSLEDRKRGNVRRLMCHSTATAEKFYEADLGFSEAFLTREDTAAALANTFKNRCKMYKNTQGKKTDIIDKDDSVSQSTKGGEEADKGKKFAVKETGHKEDGVLCDSQAVTSKGVAQGKGKKMTKRHRQDSDSDYTETFDSNSSEEDKEADKGKKHVVKGAAVQHYNQMITSKGITKGRGKKMTKSGREDGDSNYTESGDSSSSQEEEEADKGKKQVVTAARVQSYSRTVTSKDNTQVKRKKMSKRHIQVIDSDDTETGDSKSSEEEEEADKGKKQVAKEARVQSVSRTMTSKGIVQDKRKKMTKKHGLDSDSDYTESGDSKSSEEEGEGEEVHVQQESEMEVTQGATEEKGKTGKQDEIRASGSQGYQIAKERRSMQIDSDKGSNGRKKRVRQDKNNDTERPDEKVIKITSSSEEIEDVRKTTGEPVQQTVKHDKAKKCPRLSCTSVNSPRKRNHLSKSPRAKYSYLRRKGNGSPIKKLRNSRRLRLRNCQVVLTRVNTKALEELKRQREGRARKGLFLQEPQQLTGGPEKHEEKNLTEMTAEDMTKKQKQDSHQAEVKAGNQEKHPMDNTVLEKDRKVDSEDGAAQAGDAEGDPEDSEFQSRDREGDPEDGPAQTEDREGALENGAVQAGDLEEDPVNSAEQRGYRERDPEDCEAQAGDRGGELEDGTVQTGDTEGDPEDGAVQADDQKGEPVDCAEQAGDREGDPEDGAIQADDQKGEPVDCAEQAGDREGDPEDGAVQTGDTEGDPEDGAVQADDQKGEPVDCAEQAGDREGDPEDGAVKVGHQEGDKEDGAVQAEEQKGDPEDSAEQAGERDGDPEDGAVQADDQKGEPVDCAEQAGDREGDPEDGAVQADDQKGEPVDCAEQAGDREGDPEDGAVKVGHQEGDKEDGAVQAEEQKGDPEDSAEQAGERDGDPESGAVQAGDREGDSDNRAGQTGDQERDPEDGAEQAGHREGDLGNGTEQIGNREGDSEDGALQTGDSKGGPEDGALQARETVIQKRCFKLPRQSIPLSAETKRSSLATKKSPSATKKVLGKHQLLMKRGLKRQKRVQEDFSPPQLRVRKEKEQESKLL